MGAKQLDWFVREVGCRATFVLQHCAKHSFSPAVQHYVLKTRRLADTDEERRAGPLLGSAPARIMCADVAEVGSIQVFFSRSGSKGHDVRHKASLPC